MEKRQERFEEGDIKSKTPKASKKKEEIQRNYSDYLLVSDMDGTLLNNQGLVSNENIEAIKKFQSMGGRFTLATGRPQSFTWRVLESITLDAPAILYNGAVIYDFKEDKVLWEKVFEEDIKDLIRKLYDKFPEVGIGISCGDKYFILRHSENTLRTQREEKITYYSADENFVKEHENTELLYDAWERPWNKVLISDTTGNLREVERFIVDNYKKASITTGGLESLEIGPEGVSKGEALKLLAKEMGISLDKIIAVGDNLNDVEMLKTAGHSFAVANCREELKDCADYIICSNEEHALVELTDWILKEL